MSTPIWPLWMVALGLGCGPAAAGEAGSGAAAGDGPVLVELFTSQGCSSCPPADALLSRLGRARAGAVIPLAFHVDYWDDLGWADPFAAPGWSQRQRDYAASLPSRVYTPQLVVDGRADVVGSRAGEVDRLVAAAAKRSHPARVSLRRDGDRVRVIVDLGAAVPAAEVMLAVTSSGERTAVRRGENAGRTLTGDYVVRRLERIGRLDGRLGRIELSAAVPAGRAVVFVQASDSGAILGVAELPGR